MDQGSVVYLSSAANFAYLLEEHARLELRKASLLEDRKNPDSCDCKTDCGSLSVTFHTDYALVLRQLDECIRKIRTVEKAVLPNPKDRSVLLPGLRARLRKIDRSGRSRGDPIRYIEVGINAEYHPTLPVPIIGASCRQILPFIGKPRGFRTEVHGPSGNLEYTMLLGIERPKKLLAA